MTLQASWDGLAESLDLCTRHFRDFVQTKTTVVAASDFSFLDECLLEGLMSRAWQAWSAFCRDCVVKSCLGTTTSAGIAVTALVEAINEEHISGAAIRANRKTWSPILGKSECIASFGNLTCGGTWTPLVRIIGELRPSNAHLNSSPLSRHVTRTPGLCS